MYVGLARLGRRGDRAPAPCQGPFAESHVRTCKKFKFVCFNVEAAIRNIFASPPQPALKQHITKQHNLLKDSRGLVAVWLPRTHGDCLPLLLLSLLLLLLVLLLLFIITIVIIIMHYFIIIVFSFLFMYSFSSSYHYYYD